MAVPSYTNDLVDWIADTDTTAWLEFTNMAFGGVPDEADTESALQGTNTVSQATNTTSLFSMGRILGASVTLATNDVFLVWHGHGVATALLPYASGGLRLVAATTLGDWKAWAVGGNDTPPFPYGKWVNNPIDPSIAGEFTLGTPPAALTFFGVGSAGQLSAAVAKGQPHVTDIIRYGRAQSRFTGGETANFGTFAGFAALNDATSARWGLIQVTAGGYLWKGIMLLGLSTVATTNRARTTNVATLTTGAAHGFRVGDTLIMTGIGGVGYNVTATVASVPTTTTFTYSNTGGDEGSTADIGGSINGVVDFRDSNKTILIQDTRKVYAAFNKIEIRNASSRVDWTSVNVTCLSPSSTASKGDFEVVTAGADVNFNGCTFTDMNTFIFGSNSSVIDTTFIRCGLITGGGGIFNGSSILTSTVAVDVGAFLYNETVDPDGEMDNMTFSKGTNAHHAIDFGTAVTANITLRGCEFTGFGSTGDSNDSTVRFLTTGSLTLSLIGCTVNGAAASTGNFSVDDAAGTGVTLSISPVTVTVTTKDAGGTVVGSANVFLKASSGTGTLLPVSAAVNSITRIDATTAEATHAAVHNMSTGDKVYILGANQAAYNGVFAITLVGVASPTTMYRYTPLSDPVVNATGTLTATFVFLKGTTDSGTGVITMSRVVSENQSVIGWARKSSLSDNPKYKNAPISGTVLAASGLTATAVLILDQ